MAITTKPTSYTVNTSHAKCPDHLWMLDENTGSVAYDKGKASTKSDMTLYEGGSASANLWKTDTLGTAINCRDATVSTRYGLSATHTFNATTSMLMVVYGKSTNTTGTTNEYWLTAGNSGAFNNRIAIRGQPQFDSYVDAYMHDGTTAFAANGLGAQSIYTQAWVLAASKFKDGELAATANAGGWGVQSAAALNFPIASGSTPNRFGIGTASNNTPDLYFNGDVLAAMVFVDNYTAWDDAFMSSLYSDPWQFLNTTPQRPFIAPITSILSGPSEVSGTGSIS